MPNVFQKNLLISICITKCHVQHNGNYKRIKFISHITNVRKKFTQNILRENVVNLLFFIIVICVYVFLYEL